jgi:hypothetical protein
MVQGDGTRGFLGSMVQVYGTSIWYKGFRVNGTSIWYKGFRVNGTSIWYKYMVQGDGTRGVGSLYHILVP